MATNRNTNTEKQPKNDRTALIVLALNLAVIGCIIIGPAHSVPWANRLVEWGLLTRIGGHHNLITLGYTGGLGIGPFNILAILGVLTVVNVSAAMFAAIRSTRHAGHTDHTRGGAQQ